MRIGISTSVIQRGKTGIARYLFGLLRGLLPYASQHEFVLYVLEEDLPLFDFVKGKMELAPVPERYRPPLNDIAWHQTQLPRRVRERGLDLLHIPSYRRMLWPRPCPRVTTVHDLAAFHIPGKYDAARMAYGKWIVPRLAKRQDRIIAISRNTARDVRTFLGYPEDRIEVIHNGLDHGTFYPAEPEAGRPLAETTFGLDKPFFLYLARLEHPAKNHVRLIRAFERFKEKTGSPWLLVFAGSDWHGAETIHESIRRSPQREAIRSLGFVADDQIPGLLRAASGFVYPSLFEGFGFPPIEAMACGCPVICSTRGALQEVVGDAALTIDPESVDSMEEALARLANHPAAWEGLRQKGIMQAARFDWEVTAKNTLKIYHQTLRSTGSLSKTPRFSKGKSPLSQTNELI